jgi:hypothetical protein
VRTATSRNTQHFNEKLRRILTAWHNCGVAIQADQRTDESGEKHAGRSGPWTDLMRSPFTASSPPIKRRYQLGDGTLKVSAAEFTTHIHKRMTIEPSAK